MKRIWMLTLAIALMVGLFSSFTPSAMASEDEEVSGSTEQTTEVVEPVAPTETQGNSSDAPEDTQVEDPSEANDPLPITDTPSEPVVEEEVIQLPPTGVEPLDEPVDVQTDEPVGEPVDESVDDSNVQPELGEPPMAPSEETGVCPDGAEVCIPQGENEAFAFVWSSEGADRCASMIFTASGVGSGNYTIDQIGVGVSSGLTQVGPVELPIINGRVEATVAYFQNGTQVGDPIVIDLPWPEGCGGFKVPTVVLEGTDCNGAFWGVDLGDLQSYQVFQVGAEPGSVSTLGNFFTPWINGGIDGEVVFYATTIEYPVTLPPQGQPAECGEPPSFTPTFADPIDNNCQSVTFRFSVYPIVEGLSWVVKQDGVPEALPQLRGGYQATYLEDGPGGPLVARGTITFLLASDSSFFQDYPWGPYSPPEGCGDEEPPPCEVDCEPQEPPCEVECEPQEPPCEVDCEPQEPPCEVECEPQEPPCTTDCGGEEPPVCEYDCGPQEPQAPEEPQQPGHHHHGHHHGGSANLDSASSTEDLDSLAVVELPTAGVGKGADHDPPQIALAALAALLIAAGWYTRREHRLNIA